MSAVSKVAQAELSYLVRSRLAFISAALFAACLIFATLSSSFFLAKETQHRSSHQAKANDIFENQPDRHPHRMVHYGQYVFRTPPPLAAIDPGLDAYGGTSIFLEGHRQNAAMFAEASEGAALTRFGSFTPAFVLQVFAPLLLILLGYSSVTREREAGTLRALLAQGASMRAIASGKAMALFGAASVCLAPLVIVGVVKVLSGEETMTSVAALILSYALYLSVWVLAVLCVSLHARRGAGALLILTSLWLASVVIVPRLAVDVASQAAPLQSAFERDIEVKAALRALGDAHNLKDPANAAFQQKLLAQYDAENIDDLPVNIKGLLAIEGERQGAEVIAAFNASDIAARETQQSWVAAASLLSPMIAIHSASQTLSGTDLAAYHRFQSAAETHRLAFVQALNMLQATQVDIKLDTMKSVDVQAEQATRISAKAWSSLPQFRFTPTPLKDRLRSAALPVTLLLLWLGGWVVTFLRYTRGPQL